MVSRRLGHANVSIAMETSGHVMRDGRNPWPRPSRTPWTGADPTSLPPFSRPSLVLGDRVQGIVCGTPSRNMPNPPLGTIFSIGLNPRLKGVSTSIAAPLIPAKPFFGTKPTRSRPIGRGRLGRTASLSQLVSLPYRPLCGLSNPHENRPTDGDLRSDFPTSLKICSTAPSYVIAAPFLAAW